MTTYNGTYDAVVALSDGDDLSGMARRGVLIHAGAHCRISGSAQGRLVLEPEAYLQVSGQADLTNAVIDGTLILTGKALGWSGQLRFGTDGRLLACVGAGFHDGSVTLVLREGGVLTPISSSGESFTIYEDDPQYAWDPGQRRFSELPVAM